MQLQYLYNFLATGDVVTRDGEFLGTWERDAEGHPLFYPEGRTGVCLWNVALPLLSDEIHEWVVLGKPDDMLVEAHSTTP